MARSQAQTSRQNSCVFIDELAPLLSTQKEFLKYKPLSQHTGTTRARTGADWHTHRLTTGAA